MESFVLHILKLNVIAVLIIISVKALSFRLKGKFTAQWRYLIWLVLSLSLLIPLRFPEEASLFRVQTVRTETSPGETKANPPQNTGTLSEDSETSLSLNASDTPAVSLSLTPQKSGTGRSYFQFRISPLPVSLSFAAGAFLILWLTVAFGKLLLESVLYRRSVRSLARMSLPVYDSYILQAYRSVCRQKGVRTPPALMQNASLTTPLLTGLFKPALYLPSVGYTAEELKLIFHHELSHYHRKDLWYKALLRTCASVYWFNPCLRMMLKEAECDIENLCDANVVRHCTAPEHRLYRRLLLRTVAIQNQIPYVAASLNESTSNFKDRILYMANLKRLNRSFLPGILLAVLLFTVNAVFAFSPTESSPAASLSAQNSSAESTMPESGPQSSAAAAPATEEIPAVSPIPMEYTPHDMYTLSGVNVRSLPSLEGSLLTTVSAGSTVTVTGAGQNGWIPVKAGNVSGYIHGEYLTSDMQEAQAALDREQALQMAEATQNAEASASSAETYTETSQSETEAGDADTGYETDSSAPGLENDSDSDAQDIPAYDTDITQEVNDPFDLFTWDSGTNKYIPFQQAEGPGLPIGQGSGVWYYFNELTGTYELW